MRIISLPGLCNAEIGLLKVMLHEPYTWIHVRKPEATAATMKMYVAEFSHLERRRLVMHQFQEEALDWGIPNIHFPARKRRDSLKTCFKSAQLISTSTHNWDEFNSLAAPFDAAFLSPFFPSISKEGYGKNKTIRLGKRTNKRTQLIALGGLDAQRIQTLKTAEIDDFAFCGAIWQATNPLKTFYQCYHSIHL